MTGEKTIGTWKSMFDRKYEIVDAPILTCKKCGGNLDKIGAGKWICKSCNIEYMVT